jgi:hypothetical protein
VRGQGAFKPAALKLLNLNVNRAASGHRRMCWTCAQEKPVKGGSFPDFRPGSGHKPDDRFRCGDCSAARIARLAAKELG